VTPAARCAPLAALAAVTGRYRDRAGVSAWGRGSFSHGAAARGASLRGGCPGAGVTGKRMSDGCDRESHGAPDLVARGRLLQAGGAHAETSGPKVPSGNGTAGG